MACPNLIMLIGISGCGKSTYANHLKADVVSSDEIRRELFGDEDVQSDPSKVFSVAHKRVADKLSEGKDVIFDATNVTSFARNSILNFCKGIDCCKIAVLFMTEPKKAIEQQKNRSRQVPEEVIYRQYKSLLKDIDDLPSEFDQIVCVP